jgi:diadenosine tetraphosphatase ApaH/serine/threonine PP2A family protein phosphatase
MTPECHPLSVWAIISDIHSNLEALRAVGDDIAKFSPEKVICLGDIVGYGPNPVECVDIVRENCDLVILGNHDQGALFDPEGFNNSAERAIFWTRAQLENSEGPEAQARWEFLTLRPRRKEWSATGQELEDTRDKNGASKGLFLFVHGSARHPLNEYVFPEDVYNERKMERIFQLVSHYCFQGHTHVPGVFTEDYKFFSPTDMGHRYQFDQSKAVVNVGSVGQPRDGDWRACYVILETDDDGGPPKMEYRRVEYDVETTVKKIHAIPELDRFLGDRLRDGR